MNRKPLKKRDRLTEDKTHLLITGGILALILFAMIANIITGDWADVLTFGLFGGFFILLFRKDQIIDDLFDAHYYSRILSEPAYNYMDEITKILNKHKDDLPKEMMRETNEVLDKTTKKMKEATDEVGKYVDPKKDN